MSIATVNTGNVQGESKRSRSPFLGELTNEEWTKLQCRHAELHLSFLVPAGN